MRKTPTKVVEKGNDKLKSNVKTAATILIAALGLTVATSQDANAQMFSDEGIDEVAEMAQKNEQKRNTIAEIDEDIEGQNETIAEIDEDIEGQNETIAEKTEVRAKKNKQLAQNEVTRKNLDAQIAELKGKKGDKQPPKWSVITRDQARAIADNR